MDRSQLTWWTLDAEPSLFLGFKVWFLTSAARPAQLWWDMAYVHRFFLTLGYSVRFVDFTKWLGRIARMGVHIPSNHVSPNVVSSICTTWALYTFLVHVAQLGRTPEITNDLQRRILATASRVGESIDGGGSVMYVGSAVPCQLRVYKDGRVHGFCTCARINLGESSTACLFRGWEHLRATNQIFGQYSCDSHSIQDITCLLLRFFPTS